ncbi:hypothetical protein M378DRAFT_9524 [Amanita muscaria Koide BX008]|uniref:Uncharacterized protein n=1 Tax=Amanita muscaria (strain Koide BX008) TaxID=946122 RepID=A0A0C2XEM6_AMAMK|nr:hypothetical protein M378DRAFT_9524 [Amanita muscaria Koide BX008]
MAMIPSSTWLTCLALLLMAMIPSSTWLTCLALLLRIFSNASSASMADDQVFHPSCETVSEAASRTDLSSSTSMGLIATMNNLVIDEGSDLEEGIAKEPAADNERTISEDSVARQTAEKTAPRDDSEGAGDEVVESFGEERSEAPQSGHEGSTEEDGFDSQPLVTIVCSCSCSAYVNLSGINLGVSSGSETETELFEDVAVAPCLSRSSYGSMMSLKKSQMKARKGKINLGMAIKH